MPRGPGVVLRTAEWLCDNFGDGGEDAHQWIDEAHDLIDYLRAHGITVKRQRASEGERTGVWRAEQCG